MDVDAALTLALDLADLADGITTKRFRASPTRHNLTLSSPNFGVVTSPCWDDRRASRSGDADGRRAAMPRKLLDACAPFC